MYVSVFPNKIAIAFKMKLIEKRGCKRSRLGLLDLGCEVSSGLDETQPNLLNLSMPKYTKCVT